MGETLISKGGFTACMDRVVDFVFLNHFVTYLYPLYNLHLGLSYESRRDDGGNVNP